MILTMFRTRDFVLIFTTIIFLIVAIGATIWNQYQTKDKKNNSIVFSEVTNEEYKAEVLAPKPIAREERLKNLREKIAEDEGVTISAPEPEITNDETVGETVEMTPEDSVSEVQICSGYKKFTSEWQADGISFNVSEGARIVYKEVSLGLSTESSTSSSSRNILLQLPIRTFPTPPPSCLMSDVVGIAKDGSLIRNNEVGLYGIFGDSTLIGYALDGFPIYGVTDSILDECGGMIVGGQYGYYLSTGRDVVLYCFSANPVNI